MPEFKYFTLEEEEHIAIFTMCREEKLNAMNSETWAEVDCFADYLEKNDDIRVGIMTGTGDKSFVAGSDINGLANR